MELKKGMIFTHSKWLGENRKPLKCIITKIQNGKVYWKGINEEKSKLYFDIEDADKYILKNSIEGSYSMQLTKEERQFIISRRIAIAQHVAQEAGKLELVKTDLKTAREYAENLFSENGKVLEQEIPNFDKNYNIAKNLAKLGYAQRKDMPVINTSDVKLFQERLKQGTIDINAPYSPETQKDPFPEGLKGKEAVEWLKKGLRIYDGAKDETDDIIKIKIDRVKVGDLRPIQKQIYFDKAMKDTAKFGAKGSTDFLTTKSIFICSNDNYIIDGHHRFLAGVLIDPNMKVQVLKIDLPIDTLLPLTLAYGDAIGNERNK